MESESKVCTKCNNPYPIECFVRSRRLKTGRCTICDTCRHSYNKEWFAKKYSEPEFKAATLNRMVVNVLKRNIIHYGLTMETYEELSAQGCAVCGGHPNGTGRYNFDHDHITGLFRGLLCSSCNLMIGSMNDDPALLEIAKIYLSINR